MTLTVSLYLKTASGESLAYHDAVLADQPVWYTRAEGDDGHLVPSAPMQPGVEQLPSRARQLFIETEWNELFPVDRDGKFTIEMWFYANDVSGALFSIELSREVDEANQATKRALQTGLALHPIQRSKEEPPSARLIWDGPRKKAELPWTIYPGKWYYLVVVLDAEYQLSQAYLNSIAMSSEKALEPPTDAVRVPLQSRISIGKFRQEHQQIPAFAGSIDEFALYDRRLTSEQVVRHYRAAFAGTGQLESVKTIGHRGNKMHAPENTLISLQQAIDLGSSILEMDLNISSDDVIILMHDDTIDRTTNGSGRLDSHKVAELAQLDAGSWMHKNYAGEKVPTLAEAIELVNGRAVLMLDLKRNGLGKQLARTIEESRLPLEQVILGPWDDVEAAELLRYLPKATVVRIGYQPREYNDQWFTEMKRKGYAGVSVDWQTLTHDFVQAARDHGFQVYSWTINEPVDVGAALLMGVSGIITDDPAGLQTLRTSLQRAS